MCDYQRGTFECRGDGYLWDADDDGWDPNETDYPCPRCNTAVYLAEAKEEAESTLSGGNICHSYTGLSLWEGAVAWARKQNEKAALEALVALSPIAALSPSDELDYKKTGTYKKSILQYAADGSDECTVVVVTD